MSGLIGPHFLVLSIHIIFNIYIMVLPSKKILLYKDHRIERLYS